MVQAVRSLRQKSHILASYSHLPARDHRTDGMGYHPTTMLKSLDGNENRQARRPCLPILCDNDNTVRDRLANAREEVS
jgi:hypothetical protein